MRNSAPDDGGWSRFLSSRVEKLAQVRRVVSQLATGLCLYGLILVGHPPRVVEQVVDVAEPHLFELLRCVRAVHGFDQLAHVRRVLAQRSIRRLSEVFTPRSRDLVNRTVRIVW